MADLSALVPLVRELKAAGYSDAEIPGIIQQLHAQFIAPYEQAQQVMNVAGGYGLLSPMIDIARTALSGYEAALQARTGAMVPAANVLATLLGIQQNPFAVVPALATYGQLGGTPNQAAAFLLARGGEPLPPIYGSIVDELIKEFLQMVKERPQPPSFDPSQWTMAPQNAQPATTLTPEQERLIREAYSRDPVAAARFFYEAARNPEGVRRVIQAAEENLRRVREAYARDPVAAERFFREAARNPEGVRNMFGGYARGGALVTDEPMLGIGVFSGVPRFIVGEEGPEKLDIQPLSRKKAAKQRVELLLRTPVAPGSVRAFAQGGSAISLPPGFRFSGGRLTYRDPRITSKHRRGLRVSSSITESEAKENSRKLENFNKRTLELQNLIDSGSRLVNFSPGTRRALRDLAQAAPRLVSILRNQEASPSASSAPTLSVPTSSAPLPPELSASPLPPPTSSASPPEPPSELPPEPPHVAAARLLGNALSGHTMFAPDFVSALQAGQLPTFLPSYSAFATLSPVLQEALLGYLTQASGGALTREQILGSILQSAPPRGWGF